MSSNFFVKLGSKVVPNLSLIFAALKSTPIVNNSPMALTPKGTPVTKPEAISPAVSTSVFLSLGTKFLGLKFPKKPESFLILLSNNNLSSSVTSSSFPSAIFLL